MPGKKEKKDKKDKIAKRKSVSIEVQPHISKKDILEKIKEKK